MGLGFQLKGGGETKAVKMKRFEVEDLNACRKRTLEMWREWT